ncbi:MAG: phosphoribosylformylglycinamidine synthase, partial [Actinobacteria bacterium]|nr:phosphoribosylformylglycinamidine synthase [Actinomycetota bacterium]NIS29653.1 phosphoribosylformylglycinamidine synthase [Actinomycetota bacterium]NIT95837.1 phosphoribosylformylglycinamidine synthase [Actinomycetota bacterium]NIU19524.1 phosphoribosylformylglycinamidine synthase [Actinomycetota bacterium]NIU66809.1 phosphoribosylformylglycinamidine synthase [Actinomycetota bacterium]
VVLGLLAHPDVASKEPIVRRYDHEVRGGTVVRPFVGPHADGPADAAVLKPLGTEATPAAAVLSNGICPRVGLLDPWAMALHAMDEAVRNLVAVGGDPDRVAVLDNFCWGDPTKPDRLGGLVRAVQGCTEAARRYAMPFISGKDSLFNEFDGRPIPGTLLISALGIVPDLAWAIDSAGMEPGDDLWLVGRGSAALGGSLADAVHGLGATEVPAPLADPLPRYRAVHAAIAGGHIRAAHDCSDGGIAVALAEMALAARRGVVVLVPADDLDPFTALTNEAPGRLVLASAPDERERVSDLLGDHGRRVGEVTAGDRIVLRVGETTVELGLDDAVAAFGGASS